jgi:hypothetical protein
MAAGAACAQTNSRLNKMAAADFTIQTCQHPTDLSKSVAGLGRSFVDLLEILGSVLPEILLAAFAAELDLGALRGRRRAVPPCCPSFSPSAMRVSKG